MNSASGLLTKPPPVRPSTDVSSRVLQSMPPPKYNSRNHSSLAAAGRCGNACSRLFANHIKPFGRIVGAK